MLTSTPLLLAPLDRARTTFLRHAPILRPFVVSRELRVTAGGFLGVTTAALLTLTAPLWMLAVSPVVLGVPHLLSDVRYLVMRPSRALGATWWLGIGLPVALVGLLVWPALGVIAMAGAAMLARRRTLVPELLGCAVLAATALRWPLALLVVFAHAHNVVALVLWWRIRARPAWQIAVPAVWLGVVILLLSGVADPLLTRALLGGPLPWSDFEAALAPGVAAPWSMRLVAVFAFAQSVHYSIWLRLVPDDTRRRPTPRSFGATWSALRGELGRPVLLGFCWLALGIAAWAVFDLAAARTGYLRLAVFHGYLELAALMLPLRLIREP